MEHPSLEPDKTQNSLQPQQAQIGLQSQPAQNNLQPQPIPNNLQSQSISNILQPPPGQIGIQPQPLQNNLQSQPIQNSLQPQHIQAHETRNTLPLHQTLISLQPDQTQIPMTGSTQKSTVTKVKLSDELNIFDWFRTTDIINQIAEKAKHSVDTVITALDPGMKEYLYSGGNINIMVISDDNLVSPIRDAFQTAFGRATVMAARYNPPEAALEYPIRLASGLNEAVLVAQERIRRLRSDTNGVPQNQVIVAVQPCVVNLLDNEKVTTTNGIKLGENLLPKWFLTYCMVIEDPVLLTTMNSFSQFIPIDNDTVTTAKEAKFPDGFQDKHLGFAMSVDDIMNSRLRLAPKESGDLEDCQWLKIWSGLSESQIIGNLGNSLAHLYRRKWDECVN